MGLAVAMRNAIENHSWHESAVVGGKLLATQCAIAESLKELDPGLIDTMYGKHSKWLEEVAAKYAVRRTAEQLITEAEFAIQRAAKVVPHIDLGKLIPALRGEGQTAKAKK